VCVFVSRSLPFFCYDSSFSLLTLSLSLKTLIVQIVVVVLRGGGGKGVANRLGAASRRSRAGTTASSSSAFVRESKIAHVASALL
jgi:hypothetical protein